MTLSGGIFREEDLELLSGERPSGSTILFDPAGTEGNNPKHLVNNMFFEKIVRLQDVLKARANSAAGEIVKLNILKSLMKDKIGYCKIFHFANIKRRY